MFAALLAGCSTSPVELAVETNIPAPVLAPLPLTVGVHYGDDFRQRVFEDEAGEDRVWRVDTRQAHLTLYRSLLQSMFERVVELPAPVAEQADVAAVLVPQPVTLQLALPELSPVGAFEAWVRYRIRLLDPVGEVLDEWEVAGYGQQGSAGFGGGRKTGIAEAIERAHRDLGARLIFGFAERDEVRNWLCGALAPAAAESLRDSGTALRCDPVAAAPPGAASAETEEVDEDAVTTTD